jgi:hypothetical protein
VLKRHGADSEVQQECYVKTASEEAVSLIWLFSLIVARRQGSSPRTGKLFRSLRANDRRA